MARIRVLGSFNHRFYLDDRGNCSLPYLTFFLDSSRLFSVCPFPISVFASFVIEWNSIRGLYSSVASDVSGVGGWRGYDEVTEPVGGHCLKHTSRLKSTSTWQRKYKNVGVINIDIQSSHRSLICLMPITRPSVKMSQASKL